MKLPNFKTLVGKHSSSSSIRSLLAYDSMLLSEAMCFALGSGLGFLYRIEDETNFDQDSAFPSRSISGRAPELERIFFELFDHSIVWNEDWQHQEIKTALEANRPLIAQKDMLSIPSGDAGFSLNHGLLVVGLNDESVFLANNVDGGLLEMSLDVFQNSLNDEISAKQPNYMYAVAPKFDVVDDLEEKVLHGLAKTVLYMLEPPTSFEGIAGILALAYDLANWKTLPDRFLVAHAAYQSIAKYDTDGSNFRLIFADFLEENQTYLECEAEVIKGFRDVALLWLKVAQNFKTLVDVDTAGTDSEDEVELLLSQTQQQVELLALSEQQLFEHLYILIQRKVT